MNIIRLFGKDITFIALIVVLTAMATFAQTTVFAYQGKLDFGGVPANGDYDIQVKLFDSVTDGIQQGSTLEQLNITVASGAYTVNLDFGAAVFSGAGRFLEISVRPAGSGTYSTLVPRQQITSTPYGIRSLMATTADGLSATCASCVTSSQIQNVQGSQVTGNVAGSQISGTIPVTSVPAGSGNYIQNTTSQQPASNFNVSGNGTAAGTLSGYTVNATTQYNISGQRVLDSPIGTGNLFVGINAGIANTTGIYNAFFGYGAGDRNTKGDGNSFFGSVAGNSNTTGIFNSFFGYGAGNGNTTGSDNSFFGQGAGQMNTTGGTNSFFGQGAGFNNTTGGDNSFFGRGTGVGNKTGLRNTFIGNFADFNGANPTGDNNTLLGYNAKVNSGVSNSTAIGTGAQATASNTIVIGTTQETTIVRGKLQVDTLGTAGSQQMCLNNASRLAPCSSSLRYKTDLRPFSGGMSIINRLQPVSFTWKDGGMRDMGFGAEEVEKIETLLVTYNAQGQVEGVKYDRVTAVLVNALKEQQQQIKRQESEIDALKQLVCATNRTAKLCHK